MAKFYGSTMNLQAVFKSTAKAPIDNRQVVESVADLTAENTFEGFAYDGMLVIVKATGDAYILKDASNIKTASSWVKLASDSSAAAASSVVQSQEAQASYIEIDSETATDGHKIYTVDLKTLDVASATSSSTGIADAYQVKSYVDNAVSDIETTIGENEEVVSAALNDLKDKIDNATVTISDITPSGGAKRYVISQGGYAVGTIDIPKDLVVNEGKVVDVTYSNGHYFDGSTNIDAALVIDSQQTAGYLAGKYIRLTIANSQELPLYIAATDLVDIYTTGSTSTDNVVISISNNQITASIGTGSDLAGVVTKVGGIEAGAEVNTIEGIQLNGSALSPDSNRVIDLGNLATSEGLEKVERVTAAGLNDLNGRLSTAETKLAGIAETSVKSYITGAIKSGSQFKIAAATHGCGTFPLVQVYSGNEVVTANISVDTTNQGDVTVAWEITPSEATPIRIRIVG